MMSSDRSVPIINFSRIRDSTKSFRELDKDTPIIIISATNKLNLFTALELGATGSILKPFQREAFYKELRKHIDFDSLTK